MTYLFWKVLIVRLRKKKLGSFKIKRPKHIENIERVTQFIHICFPKVVEGIVIEIWNELLELIAMEFCFFF